MHLLPIHDTVGGRRCIVAETANMRKLYLRSRPWLSSGTVHAAILLALGMCTLVRHDVGALQLTSAIEDGGIEHFEDPDIMPLNIPLAGKSAAFAAPPPLDLPEFDLPMFAGDGPTVFTSLSVQSRLRSLGEALGGRSVEFYGTVAHGDRVVFVLDASGSMNQGERQSIAPSRFQLAAKELMRTVESLDTGQSFCVILFNRACYPMFNVPQKAAQLLPANDANKHRLRQWLTMVQPMGGTDPTESLKLAVSLSPDLIFLLTDGEFRSYTGQRRAIYRDFVTINVNQIPIHAIAFKVRRRQRALMRMADESGGTYRFVP